MKKFQTDEIQLSNFIQQIMRTVGRIIMPKRIVVLNFFLLLFSNFAYADIVGAEQNIKAISVNSKNISNDCILKVENTDQLFRITTRNGIKFSIHLDELKKIQLIRAPGIDYHPVYDAETLNKMAKVISSNDDSEVPIPLGVAGPIPEENQNNLIEKASKLTTCAIEDAKLGESQSSGISIPTQNFVDISGNVGWSYGEDWAAHHFFEDFTSEEYWMGIHRPYFEEAIAFMTEQTRAGSCVERAQACSDACDFAADARSVSCAIGTMAFIEIPVAAGLYGAACAVASIRQKGICKRGCPSLSNCF